MVQCPSKHISRLTLVEYSENTKHISTYFTHYMIRYIMESKGLLPIIAIIKNDIMCIFFRSFY